MRQPSRRTNILIGQASILFISIVTTFIPQYYFYVFFIYFLIIMFIMFRTTRTWTKIPPLKELGSPIFKERNAMRVAMLDKFLMTELKKQAMASMSLLLLTMILLVIFPIYKATVFPLTYYVFEQVFENELLATFLAFLVMYEFIFGFLTLLRMIVMSKVKASNIMLPQNYVIYRSGMVLNDRFFVRLGSDYCYEYDGKRRFVEIRDKSRGSTRIRLYTDAVSELREKIRELGVVECVSVSGGEESGEK